MQASRLAAWLFGAAVCGAWLASAAGVTWQARVPPIPPRPVGDVRLDALAADVQAQAGRLRQRLASAPVPAAIDRNPFLFSSPQPKTRRRAAAPAPAPVLVAPVVAEVREPSLELIGVAETLTPDGPARTAMITGGHDELIMATAGQRILARYDVLAVGADAVELKDLETGAIRRLVLK